MKSKLRLLHGGHEDLHSMLCRFLLTYRTTPISSGKSPAEPLYNRQPRTKLDLLRPSTLKERVKVFEQNYHQAPNLSAGFPVHTLNFGLHGTKWVPGIIQSVVSPINYRVQIDEAGWKWHQNQLRPRTIPKVLEVNPW